MWSWTSAVALCGPGLQQWHYVVLDFSSGTRAAATPGENAIELQLKIGLLEELTWSFVWSVMLPITFQRLISQKPKINL